MCVSSDRIASTFSLRTLLGVIVALSMVFAVLIAIPDSVAVGIIVLISLALPVLMTAGIVYRSDNWRAFCIGGLFPAALLLLILLFWFVAYGRIAQNSIRVFGVFISFAPEIRLLAGGCWMMKNPIKALGEIALRVNDLPAMVKFYRDVVQLELMRHDERLAFFKIADGFAGHTQVLALFDRSETSDEEYVAPDGRKSTIDHIAFAIGKEDFETESRRLLDLGLDVTYAYHEWVGWRSLYIEDPESNTVELVCYDPS